MSDAGYRSSALCARMVAPDARNLPAVACNVATMDKFLSAAGASWEPGPAAGEWIAPLLDAFGGSLGHAVPAGYESYAVVPIQPEEDAPERQGYHVLGALVEQLAAFTGEQKVYTALWEGWGWLYDQDEDPRTAPGSVVWLVGEHKDEDLRQAQERMARDRVARPDVPSLELPARNYYLWSGPLASIMALQHSGDIPSLIWPEDRSWFIGAPIYTGEIAVGAEESVIQALLAAPEIRELGARCAGREHILQGDD